MNNRLPLYSTGLLLIVILLMTSVPDKVESAIELEHVLPVLTGGFGEESCYSCHFDGPLNPARGSVFIDGLPERYKSGSEYELSVRIEHPTMVNSGFQLAARNSKGEQAGRFESADGRSTINEQRDIQYVHHTYEGTTPVHENKSVWHLHWTAPDTEPSDSIFIHISAVAGNGDKTRDGDDVFENYFIVIPETE